MISRVSMRKSGLANYLVSGVRDDSKYNRSDKDNVISLYGNLSNLKEAELYTNKEKNWKHNYEHITISFSKEDMNRLSMLNDDEYNEALRSITLDMIKHRTSGYDLDSEVIAYAEAHEPKIKREFNKDRLTHIHIGISYLNPLNNTKLRTTFYNNSYISDTIDKYIALKHNLTVVSQTRIKDLSKTNLGRYRKQLQEDLSNVNSRSDLIKYFDDNNIKYKEVKTKRNHYFKVINKDMKDINLRGKGFEHISTVVKGGYLKDLKNKDLKELGNILDTYYKERYKMIDSRRSVATKKAIKGIYDEDIKDKPNGTYIGNLKTYQQKMFYKHYKHIIDIDLKGYYIDTNIDNNTKFINKSKNINIEDVGSKIMSYTNDTSSLKERVSLMLNIAEAKEWNIATLSIQGSEAFKEEVYKQIAKRLSEKENKSLKELYDVELERPMTPTQQLRKEVKEKQQTKEINKDISLTHLKHNLKAHRVLEYAVNHYGLDMSNYKLDDDNKINNLSNRQKPKNVIDFLKKEINLSTGEAINICKDLYINQPLNIEVDNDYNSEELDMSLKISVTDDDKALNGFEQIEVKSYGELATIMKTKNYSLSTYGTSLSSSGNQRHQGNVNSYNNLLIYDVDNDPNTKHLTIHQAEALLKEHNISAMILPSKSNQIEKFTESGKSKGIVDRYRIIIPTRTSLNSDLDKQTYREFQQITAKALKLDKYVDTSALNDTSRYYYKSLVSAVPIVIKSNRVMDISKLEDKAVDNIKAKEIQREEEQKRLSAIRSNLEEYQKVDRTPSNNLTYANVDKMMKLDIKQLINHFEEDVKQYKEGGYDMLKTKGAKYSVLDSNIAHNFKDDITYNSLTYLQRQYNTSNLNIIARGLEAITSDNYININIDRVKEVLANARLTAVNDKSFEEYVKSSFEVKYCRLENNSIKIADIEIDLKEIGHDKQDIIKDLQKNREELQKPQQRSSFRGMSM